LDLSVVEELEAVENVVRWINLQIVCFREGVDLASVVLRVSDESVVVSKRNDIDAS